MAGEFGEYAYSDQSIHYWGLHKAVTVLHHTQRGIWQLGHSHTVVTWHTAGGHAQT